jgi:hypothetical protein
MGEISNEELVEKAVITADALADQGKLNPAQSSRFLDFVVKETILTDNARVIRFRNEELKIDKIGIGSRVAVPKVEARDPGVRRGVTTSQVTLQPEEIMVPFELGDTFREINLEGLSVEDHVIQMFATQTANDMEELMIRGNTLGPAATEADYVDSGGSEDDYVVDNYLALQDGWQTLANDANIVDAEDQNIGLGVFGKAIRAMPTKFRRNKKDLRWFMSPDLYQLYLEKLSTRIGSLGDGAAGGATHGPFGIKAVEVPLWDFLPMTVEHITLTAEDAIPLINANIEDVVVLPSTLANSPTTPYIEDTDYTLDATAGTIARIDSGGAILEDAVVKVTYSSSPQLILTHKNNFIIGIGRDVRIEKDRDIFKGVNQYAITAKIAVEFEEVTAIVKVRNIGTGV